MAACRDRRSRLGLRMEHRPAGDRRDHRVDDGRRPASRPTPVCPEASGPDSGSTIRSRSLRAAGRRSRRVAGWRHISPSIAGRRRPARRREAAAVTTSPASPWPSRPASVRSPGRRRRVCRVRDHDVADPAVRQEIEHVALDRVARQCRERQRPDEPGRRRREQDDDVRALGGQQPEQLDRLVCRDGAGHPEGDEPPLERRVMP